MKQLWSAVARTYRVMQLRALLAQQGISSDQVFDLGDCVVSPAPSPELKLVAGGRGLPLAGRKAAEPFDLVATLRDRGLSVKRYESDGWLSIAI